MARVIPDLRFGGKVPYTTAEKRFIAASIDAATDQIELRTGVRFPELPDTEMMFINDAGDKNSRCHCCGLDDPIDTGHQIFCGKNGLEVMWLAQADKASLVRTLYHALTHVLLYKDKEPTRTPTDADYRDTVRTAEQSPARDTITVESTSYEVAMM